MLLSEYRKSPLVTMNPRPCYHPLVTIGIKSLRLCEKYFQAQLINLIYLSFTD